MNFGLAGMAAWPGGEGGAALATVLGTACAFALDGWIGEPRRWHPLVGFGRAAAALERRWNPAVRAAVAAAGGASGAAHAAGVLDSMRGPGAVAGGSEAVRAGRAPRLAGADRLRGVVALAVLLAPPVALAAAVARLPWIGPASEVLLLAFALGLRSLHEHARPVAAALAAGDDAGARAAAARLVSRDREALDPAGATVESVLENGADAVFGALFWFALAGGPGALAYRLANTLDAMWGYRTPRHLRFGWAAARFDDLLNFVPARLTAASYALLGRTRLAWACWRSQARAWSSPNAGPVMAAGAGALGVRLGGPARYGGVWEPRAPLGAGAPPTGADIERALALVRRGVLLWLAVGAFACAAFGVWGGHG